MDSPLVSIIVITYNSALFVEETLNSISWQNYSNIELIVTDDGSSDETIEIVNRWILEKGYALKRCQVITVKSNTGLVSNINRGIKACKGEWIKLIAGDDALLSDCIMKNVNFVKNNKEILVCHSKAHYYLNTFEKQNEVQPCDFSSYNVLRDNNADLTRKFEYLCLVNNIIACTVFINSQILKDFNGFDDSIPMCEDWPMWLKLTEKGINIFFLDEYTTNYRLRGDSINSKNLTHFAFSKYFELNKALFEKYVKKAGIVTRYAFLYDYYLRRFLTRIKMDKKTWLSYWGYYFLDIPFTLVRRYKNRSR